MQIPGWPESTQIQWEHRVWRAGYPVKLAGSCFLSSQHNEWFATRDRAVGSSYRQRKFPMCLEQRREAVAFGQILSLSAASVLSAAAAGLLPSLLSHQASCAGGLRKVTIQCCYGHSWDSWLCTLMVAHPVCDRRNKALSHSSSIIQFPQFSFTGPIHRHIEVAQSMDT